MIKKIIDACSSSADIAYKLSQVIPIYPITPSSPMAEYCSTLNSKGVKNIFGEDVKMVEMQSEGGVSGTVHGALLSRAFSTTFTSSQGLLLMLPNMLKMAGEGLPCVIHVSARAVASSALSIFCDHSDVMMARSTGFIMLASSSVQESQHMALASHTLAMKACLPVLHFFDGFRTSHELQKINTFSDDEIRLVIKDYFEKFKATYQDKQYGTAQNPDVFFQNREANQYKYDKVKDDLTEIFDDIAKITGITYSPFEYYGNQNAKNVIVAIGSSCQTIEEYIDNNKDCILGLIKVRLYRPFYAEEFLKTLPSSCKVITVLDRTKENGATNPLALDVMSAVLKSGKNINVLSGRYGLGGKDFTPACVNAVVNNMKQEQILKAAKELFTKYGFKKVSMDEIASETGVTKKTVYSYFSSKEELLKDVIKEELQNIRKIIDKAEKQSNDFFVNIQSVICSVIRYKNESDFFKMLIKESEMFNNEKLKDNLKIIDSEIKDYIKSKVEKAVNNKEIVVKDVNIITFLIYKMYIALIIDWNEDNAKLDEKDIADNVLPLLKYGIKRKEVE